MKYLFSFCLNALRVNVSIGNISQGLFKNKILDANDVVVLPLVKFVFANDSAKRSTLSALLLLIHLNVSISTIGRN
jgi:hypothetical protein